MINKETLSWLITVPPCDINFQMRLKEANKETVEKALKDKSVNKTKRIALERRLKWLNKDMNI